MECAAYGSKRDKLPAPKERAGQVAAFATKRSQPPGTWNGSGRLRHSHGSGITVDQQVSNCLISFAPLYFAVDVGPQYSDQRQRTWQCRPGPCRT